MKPGSQDDFEQLPTLSLSEDDLSDRMTERAGKAHNGKAHNGRAKNGRARNEKVRSRSTASGRVAITALALALLSLAGGGYLWLQELHQELQSARTQLQNVSKTVSVTGESLNRSGSAVDEVKDELKAINFEIRKLWDLSNKRNRPMIEAQENQLDDLAKNVAAARASVKKSVQHVEDNSVALKEVSSGLDGLKKELRTINADLTTSAAVNREQLDNLQKSVDKLSGIVDVVAGDNRKASDDLHRQEKTYDDRLKSLDTHRKQINQRLLQLENSVRTLGVRSGAGLEVEEFIQR